MRFRLFCQGLKNFIVLLLACLFAACACVGVKALGACRLSALGGERTFYLDSLSSQALIKRELSLPDLFRVRGESVVFEVDKNTAVVEEIIGYYGGELLFSENACGVVSYYIYVPAWGGGVAVGGRLVNLHIANDEGAGRCAVGTPLIFGGF